MVQKYGETKTYVDIMHEIIFSGIDTGLKNNNYE